jgi:hypothetical protein
MLNLYPIARVIYPCQGKVNVAHKEIFLVGKGFAWFLFRE